MHQITLVTYVSVVVERSEYRLLDVAGSLDVLLLVTYKVVVFNAVEGFVVNAVPSLVDTDIELISTASEVVRTVVIACCEVTIFDKTGVVVTVVRVVAIADADAVVATISVGVAPSEGTVGDIVQLVVMGDTVVFSPCPTWVPSDDVVTELEVVHDDVYDSAIVGPTDETVFEITSPFELAVANGSAVVCNSFENGNALIPAFCEVQP